MFLKFTIMLCVLNSVFGKGPDAGTEAWRTIVMSDGTEFPHGLFDKVLNEHSKLCTEFKKVYNQRGFLTVTDRTRLCEHACYDQITIEQCVAVHTISDTGFFNISEVGDALMTWSAGEDVFSLDDDVIKTWKTVIYRLWPILLSFIPVILAQYKKFNLTGTLGYMALMIIVTSFIDMTLIQKTHIITVTLACFLSPDTFGIVPEVIGGAFSLGIFVCVCFLTDLWIQIATAVVIFGTYGLWIHHTFVKRSSGSIPGLMIMVMLIFVMHEQIVSMRDDYKLHTFNMDVLEMIFTSLLPSGKSHWYTRNILRLSVFAVKHLGSMCASSVPFEIHLFLLFNLIQFILCFLFRALLGMFVITSMRYKFSTDNLSVGLVIYMGDIFSGIEYLGTAYFRPHIRDRRRFAYSLVNVIMMLYEFMYGTDIFMLRIVIWFFDNYVWASSYSSTPRYLYADMGRSSYPQDGSHPWIGLEKINELSHNTVIVHATGPLDLVQGMGFVIKEGSQRFLMSIDHVTRNAQRMAFGDTIVREPMPDHVNMDDDPVTKTRISNGTDGAEIPYLDKNDVSNVNSLFFIKQGPNGNSISYVSKFKFDSWGGINASIELAHGDSGGPAFAVLNNEELRYAGCTSRGSTDRTRGNYISSVCSSADYDDSDDSVSTTNSKKVRFVQTETSYALLNEIADVIHTKLKGYYFQGIDDNGGKEDIRFFESESDFIDFIKGMGSKTDSDGKWPKKRRQKVIREMSVLFDKAEAVAQTALGSTAKGYMYQLRHGFKPLVLEDGKHYTFSPEGHHHNVHSTKKTS